MADISRLIDWALAHASQIDLKVTKLQWIDSWLPGHYDYQVSITHSGVKHKGRGIDLDESVAFGKAVAESFERLAMSDYENPWATAAYLNPEGAARRAYQELLSIDRAICHHYGKVRFKNLDTEILSDVFQLKQLKKMLAKNGLVLHLYELRPTTDAKVCTMLIWHTDSNHPIKGFVNGFGCSNNLEEAAKHAAYECLRTATAIYLGNARPEEPLETLNTQGNSWWHFWSSQSKASKNYFMDNLVPLNNETNAFIPEHISYSDANIVPVETLHVLFPDLPLSIAQASAERLITPQFGPFQGDAATIKRLETFCGHGIDTYTEVPHPYG
jgi:hypothetical protein